MGAKGRVVEKKVNKSYSVLLFLRPTFVDLLEPFCGLSTIFWPLERLLGPEKAVYFLGPDKFENDNPE